MKQRVLSFILVLAMILSCMPAAFAAETGGTASGPLTLGQTTLSPEEAAEAAKAAEAPDETPAEPLETDLTKFEPSEWLPFSDNDAAAAYDADDMVTFIVVTEEKPLLSQFSIHDIANQTVAVQRHEEMQNSTLEAVKASVRSTLGGADTFEIGFTYTIATTGFSVTTAYGNKAQLEALPNVKSVYVAPTFSLPEDGMDGSYDTFTNNASTMIGADVLNSSGYTGKGMRIAILDTGIRVDHPNFGELSDAALAEPMTRDSVNAIWDTLNASQMTSMLNRSYYNNKLPYVFNYVSGDFDVSNSYAGSDHGTHVAGISAANKVADSDVVGVAPDAQLIVMQVFQPGGGASWDTIMAAMEDCVRLEVDAVNLSLGSAAGYTDPADDMLETMELFLDSDIQLLIASGNDTNNAFMNNWGYDMSLLGNPDTGLAGTPSTYSAALAVASADNDGYDQLYITVNGQDYGILDTAISSESNFVLKFRNQELEYVVIPNLGEEADYEGLDVTGKVALVSRGTTSFMEKQAAAQAAGAIACIVYNNALGIFQMQINDGNGAIPCVSVSKAAGAYLIEQAGEDKTGTLKVCDSDVKTFKVDRTVSSFSSWGVTPDLKLKPEISGVGGSIYSTVDPGISGSYYGYMSGTSMATPQITGAMAVLLEYLEANYPSLSGVEQRKVAANLLMSTADPIMAADDLEFSPRAQGAGLANLVSATTSGAYLSNPAASEGRPKVEFGDDPAKSGVYSFSFTITNMTDTAKSYTFDSSLLTEAIYEDIFIAGSPYGLEAKVQTPEQVTVEAGGTVTVNATLTLTENDKAYLAQFPNGIYVEGYLYAIPAGDGAEGEQAVTLTMPMVGFYGDWSAAPVFDSADMDSYSLYPRLIFTFYSQLGTNPYMRTGRSGDQYNAFSYNNPLYEIDFGMLRNARDLRITVTDNADPTKVYHELDGSYLAKSYYNAAYGAIIPTYLLADYGEVWDGKDASGKSLPDGTSVTYSFQAWLDDGDDVVDDEWSFSVTLDNTAPRLINENSLPAAVRTEGGKTYLTLEVLENQYVAAVMFLSENGSVMGKYELDNTPGQAITREFDITGFGSQFTVLVADYACNETEVEVTLNLGGQNDANSKPDQLDKGRLYGNETFDSALLEGGWFSASKEDFSDPRNETFDSSNRYYSAEFVNGYLIAQSTATGHLELVTPSGTYWSSKVLAENQGGIGDPGVWVLYDMALDHSGTLSASYNITSETDATDSLLAVGWLYQGDMDNDGHDDGYNALFNIKFTNYGSVYVQPIARFSGMEEGVELLTLGITTEGKAYGIGTDAALYSVGTETVWDDTVGDWGDYVIPATKIGDTDFIDYPGFGGVNVIQSMGYDHNTGTMYWYAHSQIPAGIYYDNVNVTYKVDLETAECEEVGTYGPGGQTCLFVPNDLVSDLFTMGGEPSDLRIDPDYTYMVEGQTTRLKVQWTPWSADPAEVTWSTSDPDTATVDQYGYVTAHQAGEVTISATATVNAAPYWDYDDDGNWVQFPGGPTEKTVNCLVTVMASEDALYSYIIADYSAWAEVNEWHTYADQTPGSTTKIGEQTMTYVDPSTGSTVSVSKPAWQGGTYYNGYVYTTTVIPVDDGTGAIGSAAALYKSKVTEGATPAETVIGEPELVGTALGMEISALGFDYNTGRMYCIETRHLGGLGIIDLDTGAVDYLGTYTGDLYANSWVNAMCVTADGTIVVADAFDNLYTLDPDTLETRLIYRGSGTGSMYWSAMTYNYDTGCIYWNPCQGSMASPLYLVKMPESEWGSPTVVELGDVFSKYGVQQTVIFTIPQQEPATNHIDTESISITNGDCVTGLLGGSQRLQSETVPARPTVRARTWSSSDESVVTVDRDGVLTYQGLGTATVTVSISNKDGSTFTDSIQVNVLEAAGEFQAFLAMDEGGSGYFDFWISGNDYALSRSTADQSMISIYSLRSGTYYDGYFYGYDDKGQFLRINADTPSDFRILGQVNLDMDDNQVTGMAFDYTTNTMYGLTLGSTYSNTNWNYIDQPPTLVTINLDTGEVTKVAELDASRPVFALACGKDGTLYAAGSNDYYITTTNVYTLDKTDGTLTDFTTISGPCVYTGGNYMGTPSFNSQMAYDFGTDRLYLYATSKYNNNIGSSYGMYMVQLGGETPSSSYLGGIHLVLRGAVDETEDNDVFLSFLSFIPEDDEIPVGKVNGISLNKNAGRVGVGETTQLIAQVRPSNAADPSVTWTTADPSIATVDENGLVTGVAPGVVTITVTSNETGVSATIQITVVDASAARTTAYTVSARQDALLAFDPALPAQTVRTIATFSGGSGIAGMAYAGGSTLYFVQDYNFSFYLYRYDLNTMQATEMGQLGTMTGVDDIAYDPENNLLYAVAGFYLYQYDLSNWRMGEYNNYSYYLQDTENSTLVGVEVVDGAVYTFGSTYAYAIPQIVKYSDMYLSNRTVIARDLDLPLVAGVTDTAYDASTGLFYLSDAGHNIRSVDMQGNVTYVDILGDGIDLNGLAIDATAKYTVTYTDGVAGETVFADQSYGVKAGEATPGFSGTPQRPGYTFAGWTPEVTETVTGHVTYTATWTANTYTLTLDANGGAVDPTTVTVTYGAPIGELPAPTRACHTFDGWFDENGTEYNLRTVYTKTSDTVLTAAWTKIDCVDENKDHKCDLCGETLSECADENKDHKCDLCGETLSDCTGGEPVIENEVKATCTTEGSYDEVVYCSVCREELSRETKTVEKLAHTPDEAVIEKEVKATCEKGGSYDEVVYCTECDEELSRKTVTVDALGHKDEDKDHKCDTCEEVISECVDENKDYKCDICGAELEKPEEPANDEVIRLAGAHRWETAIKVADEMKANLGVEKFDTIIIASGNDFADALAGSYLSTVKSAPILLSWGQGGKYEYLDEDNIAYIKANLAEGGTVYILGGEKAVPASYEEALKDYNVERLGGANRFETNLLILAEAGVNKGDEILVCTSTNFADSLSASATGKPILLVFNNYKALYGEQPEYLATLEDCTFTIVGGENAVCADLETAIKAYGETTRLAGENRFQTSVMVAETYFEAPETAVLAYAWNYPDGLCGGALAYSMDAPLILTMTKYEAEAVAYATENTITSGVVLGGDGLISDEAVRSVFAMDPEAEIIVK